MPAKVNFIIGRAGTGKHTVYIHILPATKKQQNVLFS